MKQLDDPAFLQRWAALQWHCPGNYADNPKIWQRTRDNAAATYRHARQLMGIEDYPQPHKRPSYGSRGR